MRPTKMNCKQTFRGSQVGVTILKCCTLRLNIKHRLFLTDLEYDPIHELLFTESHEGCLVKYL